MMAQGIGATDIAKSVWRSAERASTGRSKGGRRSAARRKARHPGLVLDRKHGGDAHSEGEGQGYCEDKSVHRNAALSGAPRSAAVRWLVGERDGTTHRAARSVGEELATPGCPVRVWLNHSRQRCDHPIPADHQ
jgi:hypothetical protein